MYSKDFVHDINMKLVSLLNFTDNQKHISMKYHKKIIIIFVIRIRSLCGYYKMLHFYHYGVNSIFLFSPTPHYPPPWPPLSYSLPCLQHRHFRPRKSYA